jgi:hypothetical protein
MIKSTESSHVFEVYAGSIPLQFRLLPASVTVFRPRHRRSFVGSQTPAGFSIRRRGILGVVRVVPAIQHDLGEYRVYAGSGCGGLGRGGSPVLVELLRFWAAYMHVPNL